MPLYRGSTSAAVTAALSTKAPLASPGFTGTAPTVNGATVLLPWSANTAYVAGQWVLVPGGYPAQRISSGSSGSSYDPTQWTEYGGGKEIAASLCDVSGAFTPSSNALVDVIQTGGANWQVQVPANSGGIMLLIPAVTVTITTGVNAATVSQRLTVYIVDEANATIAASQTLIYGTGTTQSPAFTFALGAVVANNAADKTYRVQMQVQRIGTGSASGQLNSGGVFPKAVLQAVRR